MSRRDNILPFPESFDTRLRTVVEAHQKGDDNEALRLCIQLIDEGHPEAYPFAGAFYEKGGKDLEPDFLKAKFYYERSIELRGAVEAYLGLARIYFNGLGVERDYGKAMSIYEDVARASNNPIANLMLGKMYLDGLGVEKNHSTAKDYFSRAWASGHILGLTYLGILEQTSGSFAKGLWLRLRAGYYGLKAVIGNPHDPRLRKQ